MKGACAWVFAAAVCRHVIALEHTSSGVDTRHIYSFVTRPNLRPPILNVTAHEPELLTPGYWFVGPYITVVQATGRGIHETSQIGPAIYDSDGTLIWSGAEMVPNRNAFDFRPVFVNGKTLLSMVIASDDHSDQYPLGAGLVLDDHYGLTYTIPPPPGSGKVNMHELNVMDDGQTALLLTFSVAETDGLWILDNGMIEVDLESGRHNFAWSSLGHIRPSSSFLSEPLRSQTKMDRAWDWIHANSVDKDENGDYLISGRHTSCLYKVSGVDGSIIWRLGGKESDFILEGFNFSYQHDARFRFQNRTTTIISFFNNASNKTGPATSDYSSAYLVALETTSVPMRARLLRQWDRPDRQLTTERGNMQQLASGNVVTCWSKGGYFSEFTYDGDLVYEARFAAEDFATYRTYKFNFTGRPTTDPDVASHAYGTSKKSGITVMHVSWNGATEVVSWNFYATKLKTRLDKPVPIGTARKTGFETMFTVNGFFEFIYAEALSKDGQVLGMSKIHKTVQPSNWVQICNDGTCDDTQRPTNTGKSDHQRLVVYVLVMLLLVWWFGRRHIKGALRASPSFVSGPRKFHD